MFKDSLFKKIEKKTNINKDTIMSLANKLQKSDMKDRKTLENYVDEISTLAGKEISTAKKDKIINTILNDKVPKNIDKMF